MKSNPRLRDKVIVISGGTKGVGRAAAEAFADEGARVVIGGRDETTARETIKRAREAGSEALFVHTNLTYVDDCYKLFDKAFETFGRVDGFYNYAGVTPVSPLDSCDVDVFDQAISVNFRACFFCCQRAIRYMRQSGGGSIILTGSAHAWRGQKDRAAYACSKGALLTLAEHIAYNYASDLIRCNTITLGWTMTEGEIALRKEQGTSEEELRKIASDFSPMGKALEPKDYVEPLVYLMSDESKYTTGTTLKVTAGIYI